MVEPAWIAADEVGRHRRHRRRLHTPCAVRSSTPRPRRRAAPRRSSGGLTTMSLIWRPRLCRPPSPAPRAAAPAPRSGGRLPRRLRRPDSRARGAAPPRPMREASERMRSPNSSAAGPSKVMLAASRPPRPRDLRAARRRGAGPRTRGSRQGRRRQAECRSRSGSSRSGSVTCPPASARRGGGAPPATPAEAPPPTVGASARTRSPTMRGSGPRRALPPRALYLAADRRDELGDGLALAREALAELLQLPHLCADGRHGASFPFQRQIPDRLLPRSGVIETRFTRLDDRET